jgi:tetratricopeptide (TPR) repeat protein
LIIPSSESSIAGEKECRFAYPPIWDLAYELVDEGTKRHYHRLAAQWLELRPEGREPGQQAQVGRHLQRAGDVRGASYRFRRAADGARAAYANHKAIRLYKRALSCMGDADLAARIHVWHDIGSVYQLKGEADEALDAFERMVRLSWIVASRPKAAVAYNKMGRVWRQKGSFDLALKYLERGLAMFGEVNDQRGIATSLDDIGQVFWLTGRYDEALDRSATALEMRRQAGDLRSVAVSLSNIGNIEKHRGLFDEAEACYREALGLRHKVGDRYGYVVSLNNLGALAFERGKLEEARGQWEDALGEAERIGAVPLQVILLSNLGETAIRLNRSSEARQRLQRAMTLAREIEDQRSYSEVLRNLALVELHEGNREAARRHASDCLARAEQAKLPEMIGKAHLALGEVQAATLFDASSPLTPDQSTADRHFSKAIEVFRELGNEAELARALRRLGEYRIEHGRGETARPILEEAQQIFGRLGMPEASAVRDVIAGL